MFPFSSQKLLKGWGTGYRSHTDDGSEVGWIIHKDLLDKTSYECNHSSHKMFKKNWLVCYKTWQIWHWALTPVILCLAEFETISKYDYKNISILHNN